MIAFPNCKINLGLRILRKRSDNYHDLETVFYPLPFFDVIEVVSTPAREFSFTMSGLSIEGAVTDNLCIRAYRLLQRDFPSLAAVQMHLHKSIPFGAGLGGGSADAAFMLNLLNDKFHLGLSTNALSKYALELGSDCPFFIINKPSFASGRGEELTEVTTSLAGYRIVLVNPGVPVHTGKAFAGITPAVPAKSVRMIVEQPIETWKEELINDFEPAVFNTHPSIKEVKDELYNKGAIYASMTGSGSSVYGIFARETLPSFDFPSTYLVKNLTG